MENALESKRNDNIAMFSESRHHFYSLYQLKVNKLNSNNEASFGDSSKSQIYPSTKANNTNPTLMQFLVKEQTVNKDFSLTLVSHNIPAHNESFLRENLAKRIEKGTLYASSSNISSFNLGFKKDELDIESICFYRRDTKSNKNDEEFLLCFILEDSIYNLDLFRNELDFYFKNYIEPFYENSKEFGNSNDMKEILENWYLNSVEYLPRSLKLLDDKLPILIEEAFSCGRLKSKIVKNDKITCDLNLLFEAFNCEYLISNDLNFLESSIRKLSIDPSLDLTKKNSTLTVSLNENDLNIEFSKKEYSDFSSECAEQILFSLKNDQERSILLKKPFELKQLVENFKLKLAQELNMFNRYLRKAESHFYELYKVYLYLKYSPMSQILISMYKNSLKETSSLMNVFCVVVAFYLNETKEN